MQLGETVLASLPLPAASLPLPVPESTVFLVSSPQAPRRARQSSRWVRMGGILGEVGADRNYLFRERDEIRLTRVIARRACTCGSASPETVGRHDCARVTRSGELCDQLLGNQLAIGATCPGIA